MKRFHEILLLIGQLNYTWTNTESLLIYLIAGLANVDKETAVIIFLTLNTTRARIDAFINWAWDSFSNNRGPAIIDDPDAPRIDWGVDDATDDENLVPVVETSGSIATAAGTTT